MQHKSLRTFTTKQLTKGLFPLQVWNGAFFVYFIDLFVLSKAKKLIEETKSTLFYARSGKKP